MNESVRWDEYDSKGLRLNQGEREGARERERGERNKQRKNESKRIESARDKRKSRRE